MFQAPCSAPLSSLNDIYEDFSFLSCRFVRFSCACFVLSFPFLSFSSPEKKNYGKHLSSFWLQEAWIVQKTHHRDVKHKFKEKIFDDVLVFKFRSPRRFVAESS